VVVTFLSILELAKERLLDVVQEAPMAPIYVKSLASGDDAGAPLNLSSEFDDTDPANDASVNE
jgi:segregation and condensation protein A